MVKKHLDTVIIGSGPGGYIAAIKAAQLGKQVTIIEMDQLGGTCLNTGCIPSKSLITMAKKWSDFKKNEPIFGPSGPASMINIDEFQKYKNNNILRLQKGIKHLLDKYKVEIIEGKATFDSNESITVMNKSGNISSYTFQHCIIASGSEPRELPTFPWGKRILSSSHILNLHSLPKKIAILGGGYIGIELGCAYANLGVEVTIIESQEDILLMIDSDIRKVLKRQLMKKNMAIYTNTSADSYSEETDTIKVHVRTKNKSLTVEADYLIVSAGRIPRTHSLGLHQTDVQLDANGLIQVSPSLRTSVPSIFAIGDVVAGPALAHKASYEGKLAAEVLCGSHYKIDYKAIPLVVFSDPEVAITGETRSAEHLKETVFYLSANGRALTLNQTDGLVKIYSDKETGHVKGAAIIGPNASEVITELTIAIEAGWTALDLALTIHPHPTISESIMETAELASIMPFPLTV